MAEEVINSKDAPPEGYVYMGIALANWQRYNGQLADALANYRWTVQEVPTHLWASWGHYWLGLEHHSKGRTEAASQAFLKARKCFGGKPNLLWHHELDAKCYWALKDFYQTETNIVMEESFLAHQREMLRRDLEKTNNNRS